MYSLAVEPEKYAEVLRNEVIENLENGQITAATLAKLPKMDSFLRESGRFNTTGLSKNFCAFEHLDMSYPLATDC